MASIKAGRRQHFKNRAADRFNVVFDRHAQNELVRQIQSRKAEFYDKPSNSRSRWVVEVNGKKMLVVYSNKSKSLVTAMPFEWIEKSARKSL